MLKKAKDVFTPRQRILRIIASQAVFSVFRKYFYNNKNMAVFTPESGTWEYVRIPTKANTAYTYGAAFYNDGTDNVDAVTTTEEINGILMEAKASANNTNFITAAVPRSPQCTFRGTVGTGTLTTAMIGRYVDLASSTTVDVTASTEDALEVVGYISGTEGIFKINYSKGKE